jgi:hypothetical protein
MATRQMAADSERVAVLRKRHTWTAAAIPAFLLTLYAAQCAWFIRTQSLTYDEPVHIAEGLDAWRNGRFQEYNDHPPLARLLCTLPLMNGKWLVDVEKLPAGFRVHRVSPDPILLAWRARLVNVVLGVLLGVLLWRSALKIFSPSAAIFALALFAFSPALIAHFSLVTSDGAATLLIFATALQITCWRRMPTWQNALLCGVIFGLLLLAKFSTVPMFLLAMFWMLVPVSAEATFDGFRWKWKQSMFALVIALFMVWAGYFFHVSRLTIRQGRLTATHPHWTAPLVKPSHFWFDITVSVPAGEFLAGLRDVALHNAHGQPAFFLGQISPTGGWKAYYPVTILLKWPALIFALSFAGFLLCAFRRVRVPNFGILVSFPVSYLVLAIFAHFNIGERHVLPLHPFALWLAAAVWHFTSRFRLGPLLLVAIVILHAADVLRYAPDYLSYFDIFVSPKTSYRLLADSNLDWGQGLLAMRKYEIEHPKEQISLAYFGSVDPALYGIRARALPENQHTSGTVVVSATALAGEYLGDPDGYRWVLRYRVAEVLDHCLYVFLVDH